MRLRGKMASSLSVPSHLTHAEGVEDSKLPDLHGSISGDSCFMQGVLQLRNLPLQPGGAFLWAIHLDCERRYRLLLLCHRKPALSNPSPLQWHRSHAR